MEVYARLRGQKARHDKPPPYRLELQFTSQTALSKEEVIYALDMLFKLGGIKVTPGADGYLNVAERQPGDW